MAESPHLLRGCTVTLALWAMAGLGVATWLALTFLSAPYGRHLREGFGPTIPARIGWVVMEAPAVFAFMAFFVTGDAPMQPGALALAGLWLTHYLHRVFIFPFRMRATGKRMPMLVAALAFVFNIFNAYLNGRWLSGHLYPMNWLMDARFIIGAALFFTGFAINLWADSVLFGLRTPGEGGYRIPRGGLYERISCPNYFGEILEWCGFALAAWSPAGALFAFYTVANLAPRARSNHAWYRAKFAEYPPERRALIPSVW